MAQVNKHGMNCILNVDLEGPMQYSFFVSQNWLLLVLSFHSNVKPLSQKKKKKNLWTQTLAVSCISQTERPMALETI